MSVYNGRGFLTGTTERVTSTEAEAEQVTRGKPMEKLDRMSHVHFTNPEVRASLRLEMDRDDAATAFEGRAGGAET